MNIEIREACAEDASQMLEYIKTVGAETDFLSFDNNTFNINEEKEARFIERFKKSPKDIMLVATDNGKIVANGSLETNRTKRYSHRAELSITVLKSHWRCGIGSSVIKALIEFAREKGVLSIYLDVRADNVAAISLYKRFGFKKIGTYKDYFKISDNFYDADLMVLPL